MAGRKGQRDRRELVRERGIDKVCEREREVKSEKEREREMYRYIIAGARERDRERWACQSKPSNPTYRCLIRYVRAEEAENGILYRFL